MRLDSTQTAISKTIEEVFNTPETVAGNYEWLPTTSAFYLLPKLEKVNDAPRVGLNAPTHQCNTYWSPTSVSVSDDVETETPARLFRRGLGGAVTDTVVEAGAVWDHEFAILPPQVGDFLPSFDIISKLGAADYLLAGMLVNKFKFSQSKGERVKHETELVGSGKFSNPSAIAPFPAISKSPCLDGHKVQIKYTEADGVTVVDLSALGIVVEWMLEHDNKIVTNRRRTGDPIQTAGEGDGAYVRKMPRGKYETKGSITLDFEDLTYWLKSVKNDVLQDLTITIPGEAITGTANHEFEIIVPRFSFESPDTGADEEHGTTPINILCLEDPVTRGTMTCRVRNGNATLV